MNKINVLLLLLPLLLISSCKSDDDMEMEMIPEPCFITLDGNTFEFENQIISCGYSFDFKGFALVKSEPGTAWMINNLEVNTLGWGIVIGDSIPTTQSYQIESFVTNMSDLAIEVLPGKAAVYLSLTSDSLTEDLIYKASGGVVDFVNDGETISATISEVILEEVLSAAEVSVTGSISCQ